MLFSGTAPLGVYTHERSARHIDGRTDREESLLPSLTPVEELLDRNQTRHCVVYPHYHSLRDSTIKLLGELPLISKHLTEVMT